MKAILLILIVLLLSLPYVPPTIQAQTSCPGFLPSRLVIGGQGRVLPGLPNNVRDQPTLTATKTGELPGGTVFTVLEGPQCGDEGAWWLVETPTLTGWTMEGQQSEYWLEPVTSVGDSPQPTAVVLPQPTSTTTIRCTVQGSDLEVGMTAVPSPSLSGIRLRETPAGTLTGQSVEPGEKVVLLAGPECAILEGAAATWWQVQRADGTTGWAMQQSGSDIYFRPWSIPCNKRWNPVLQVGDLGEALGYEPRTLFSEPNGSPLAQFNPGHMVRILEGPLCDPDDLVWWRVDLYGQEGWVIAKDDTGFHFKPWPFPDESDDEAQGRPQGQLAYTTIDGRAFLVDADGSNLRLLTTNTFISYPNPNLSAPAWSPDGRTIAIAREIDNSGSEIFLIDVPLPDSPEGLSDPRQITTLSGWNVYPAWSPDGSQIAFLANAAGSSGQRIVVMNADGSNPVTLYEEFELTKPIWSPDGLYLAFTAKPRAKNGAYQYAVENKTIVIKVNDPSQPTVIDAVPDVSDEDMAWLPDNRLIFWEEAVYVASPDGSSVDILYRNQQTTWEIALSPDGNSLILGNHFYLYVMPTTGDAPVRITFPLALNTPGYREYVRDAEWSSDGQWITFLGVVSPDATATNIAFSSQLQIMDADGSGRHTLALGEYEDLIVNAFAWRPLVP